MFVLSTCLSNFLECEDGSGFSEDASSRVLSSSSLGEDEDESIILVSQEEEGKDPLWTLVNKVGAASVGHTEPSGKNCLTLK